MALDALAKQSTAGADAGATRAQPNAKGGSVKPRPGTLRPSPRQPQQSWQTPLDFQWFDRNLRKYPVQVLPPQAAKTTRRSVTAETAKPESVPAEHHPIASAIVEKGPSRPLAAPLLMSPAGIPAETVTGTPLPQISKPVAQTRETRGSVQTLPEQRPANPVRGEPKTLPKQADLKKEDDALAASPLRWHVAAPPAKDRSRSLPAVTSAAQPPSSAPAARPPRSKGMQALKDAIYLPFRIANVGLATVATVVTLGKAWPLLRYSVERLGESLAGFGRTLFNVLRVMEVPHFLGMESPRPRSASKVTGPARAAPAALRRPASIAQDLALAPEQRLQWRREAVTVPKRTARMTALVINQLGRAITTSVGLGGMVIASMAVTAVMPPLGFVMFGLTALGAWTAAANLKCAAKNYRRLQRGEATLPVGSSAAANAWFRGIELTRHFRGPDEREAARKQAARGAKMLTLLNAGVQMGASLASGVAAAPVVIGLFVKKVAPGLSSAVMGWVAETVASRVGARLRAEAEKEAWAVFDQVTRAARYSWQLTGVNPSRALRTELRAWGIQDEALSAWLAPTTDGKPVRELRPPEDQAGKYLTQMTDQNFAATLLRNAAITMVNFR